MTEIGLLTAKIRHVRTPQKLIRPPRRTHTYILYIYWGKKENRKRTSRRRAQRKRGDRNALIGDIFICETLPRKKKTPL